MLCFVVNLLMMFIEVLFIECFVVVVEVGFQVVEFLFFYGFVVSEIKVQLLCYDLMLVLFNILVGDIVVGEWGCVVLLGCEYDVCVDIDLVLEYVLVLECEQVYIMVGVVLDGVDGVCYCVMFIDNLCYVVDWFVVYDKCILIEVLSFGVKFGYFFFS